MRNSGGSSNCDGKVSHLAVTMASVKLKNQNFNHISG